MHNNVSICVCITHMVYTYVLCMHVRMNLCVCLYIVLCESWTDITFCRMCRCSLSPIIKIADMNYDTYCFSIFSQPIIAMQESACCPPLRDKDGVRAVVTY